MSSGRDVLLYRAHLHVSNAAFYLTMVLILVPWMLYRSVYGVVVAEMDRRRRDPDDFIRDVERARFQRAEVARLLKEAA